MDLLSHLFKLAAGIGLFLFAMYLLEESLKNLSGRKFKLFLQKITKNRYSAAAGGAIVTAILQSSSMVSLMVLAFVGAGVFTMRTALALILGANLGTTLSNWLVATVGFSMDIELIAYPAICIGGILLITLGKRKTTKYISYFLFGFGLLFVALSFMKTAMEGHVRDFDLTQYNALPLIVFLIIGFFVTVVVQSSSVTMALTLSALHAGAITFAPAAALVLGSELGTIIKLLIGAIGGGPVKKRVALGNFIFNLVLMTVAFALLRPIIWVIYETFGIRDPLIGLVMFSTMINLMGILIFLPFLDPFSKFLERFFKGESATAAAYIGQAIATEPETALDLFRRETHYFIYNSMLFNLNLFEIEPHFLAADPEFKRINAVKKLQAKDSGEQYDFLKELQGELQAFYLVLRTKIEAERSSVELVQLISAVRSAMYSTKCIKDIGNNISNLHGSSKEIKFAFFQTHQQETKDLYLHLSQILHEKANGIQVENYSHLQELYLQVENSYQNSLNEFYQNAMNASLEDVDMTTVINFNRELFTANKAILMAVKDLVLDEKEAQAFSNLPVYRT
jgi:phosphate:Na+ symporter